MSEAKVQAMLQDLNARGITTLEQQAMLQYLNARGITTLEQFVASKVRMRPLQRVDTEEAEEERSAQPASPDLPYKSTIGAPDPSVAIVLDGKRVDYDAVAELSNQPLHYFPKSLEGGKQALVISSDQSIANARRFRRSGNPFDGMVEKTLMSVGLRPAIAGDVSNIGIRIFSDHHFSGDSTVLPPDWEHSDLREFDAGLDVFGGDWGDKISSVDPLGHTQWRGWEMSNFRGSDIFGGEVWEMAAFTGWNDNISSIRTYWVPQE